MTELRRLMPIHVRVEINGRGTAFREEVAAAVYPERTVQLVARAQTWMNQRIAEVLTEAWGLGQTEAVKGGQAIPSQDARSPGLGVGTVPDDAIVADHQRPRRVAVEDEAIARNRPDAGQVREPRSEPHGEGVQR